MKIVIIDRLVGEEWKHYFKIDNYFSHQSNKTLINFWSSNIFIKYYLNHYLFIKYYHFAPLKFQIVDHCYSLFFFLNGFSYKYPKITLLKKSVFEFVVLGHKHRHRINMKNRGSAKISAKWVPVFSVFSFILGMIITTRSLYLDLLNFLLYTVFIRFFSVLGSCLLHFILLNWN